MSRGLSQVDSDRTLLGSSSQLPIRRQAIRIPYRSTKNLASASPKAFDTP